MRDESARCQAEVGPAIRAGRLPVSRPESGAQFTEVANTSGVNRGVSVYEYPIREAA